MERYKTGTSQILKVHDKDDCAGKNCVIHNPSNHHMRSWPTHWRKDRGIMERICPCGVGHPDPDDTNSDTLHGCCSCCDPNKFKGE